VRLEKRTGRLWRELLTKDPDTSLTSRSSRLLSRWPPRDHSLTSAMAVVDVRTMGGERVGLYDVGTMAALAESDAQQRVDSSVEVRLFAASGHEYAPGDEMAAGVVQACFQQLNRRAEPTVRSLDVASASDRKHGRGELVDVWFEHNGERLELAMIPEKPLRALRDVQTLLGRYDLELVSEEGDVIGADDWACGKIVVRILAPVAAAAWAPIALPF